MTVYGEPDSIDDVLANYLDRLDDGQPVDRLALLAEHPQLAKELSKFFDDWDAISQTILGVGSQARSLAGPEHDSVCLDQPEAMAQLRGTSDSRPTLADQTSLNEILSLLLHLDELSPEDGCAAEVADWQSQMQSLFRQGEGNAATLGRFQLSRLLGRGGFGIVFLSEDATLRRSVALKIPRPEIMFSRQAKQRFLREAQLAALLDHPAIVPVYETGELGPLWYVASAYCAGPTLAAWLANRREPVPARLAAHIVEVLSDAVQHAHSRGVLHRDLKPSNILLEPNQKSQFPEFPFVPKVTDFGLGIRLEESHDLTRTGMLLGTTRYMAPEQARGDAKAIGVGTDIYSLGVILYELLAGQPPFSGKSNSETLRAIQHDPPAEAPLRSRKVPRDLQAICLKCLAKQPGLRYSSAAELTRDLQRHLGGHPVIARSVGPIAHCARWCGRHPATAGLLAGLLVVTLIGGIGIIWRGRQLEHSYAETRRLLYVSDMKLALREVDDANLQPAKSLLERYLPAAGAEDLRSFEWYYLWQRSHSDVGTLYGHRGQVSSAEFSPDGSTIASVGYDGALKLWDVATGKLKVSIDRHSAPVVSVVFSPDGKSLATCSRDYTVVLGDARNGQPIQTLQHNDEVVSVAFSPKGNVVATACHDGAVTIWDTTTGNRLKTLQADAMEGIGVAFSPNGELMATCGKEPIVKFWSTVGYTQVATLAGHDDTVYDLAFSPDGQTLATGGKDRSIILWDVATRTRRHKFPNEKGSVRSLAFSADGTTLAAAGQDPTIHLWDTMTQKLRPTIYGHMRGVRSLAFSPTSSLLVSASDDATVKIWDLSGHKGLIHWTGHSKWIRTVAFSPDGRKLASGSDDGTVKIWDGVTGEPLTTFTEPTAAVSEISFSPNGELLAAASDDRSVYLWNVASGQHVSTLMGHTDFVNSLAFSPNGKHLASASKDMTIRLCEISSGRNVFSFRAHDGPVTSVRFSPSGMLLATGSNDKTAKLWEVSTGQMLMKLVGHGDSISCVAFSPDGKTLTTASRDASIRLWDVRTGHQQSVLLGHPNVVRRVAYFPDGKLFVTSSRDHTLKLWDAGTGEERGTLKGHSAGASGVCVAPDGNSIASADEYGAIILWHAPKMVRHLGSTTESTNVMRTSIRY